MQRSIAILHCALLACASPALLAQAFADAGLELLHNDNVGRAAWNSVADRALGASFRGGYHFRPGNFTGLTVQGSLQQQVWNRLDGLDTLDAGLQLDLSHKFGIGADRPVLTLGLGYTRRDVDNDQRDADLRSLRLALQQRVLERLQLQLDLHYEHSDGAARRALPAYSGSWSPLSGKVWDFSGWSVGLQGEVDLGERTWLDASWRFRDGPVVSTLQNYRMGMTMPGALAAGWDAALGTQAVAYQLDARTRSFTLDYNLALFGRSTWYLGGEYHDSTASNGNAYKATLLRSGFLHSF